MQWCQGVAAHFPSQGFAVDLLPPYPTLPPYPYPSLSPLSGSVSACLLPLLPASAASPSMAVPRSSSLLPKSSSYSRSRSTSVAGSLRGGGAGGRGVQRQLEKR